VRERERDHGSWYACECACMCVCVRVRTLPLIFGTHCHMLARVWYVCVRENVCVREKTSV